MTTIAEQVTVRPSRDDDVEAMLAIYRPHIARGVDPAHAHESEPMQPDDLKRKVHANCTSRLEFDAVYRENVRRVTAFFARPGEYGPHQKRDYAADQAWDVVAKDIEDLATQLGA